MIPMFYAEASNQTEEDSAFASGATMVVRIDLLPGYAPPPPPPSECPVIQGSANTSVYSESATQTVTLPSGIVSGDLLCFYTLHNYGVSGCPAGWTEPVQDPAGYQHFYYRIADGTEDATVSYTVNQATQLIAVALRISSASAVRVAQWAGNLSASGSTISAPSVTSTVNNSLAVCFFSTTHSGATMTEDNGFTEFVEFNTGNPAWCIVACSKEIPTAGATGVTTATLNAAKTTRNAISLIVD